MSTTTRPFAAPSWVERIPSGSPHLAPGRSVVTRRVVVALTLGVILGVFAVRCARAALRDSITSDESTHLVHTLHFWLTGDDWEMWKLGAPRLPHALGALASFAALRPTGLLPSPGATDPAEELTGLVLSGANRVLVPARFVAIGWGIALLLAVFWAVARQQGPAAGLMAAGLLSLVPEVLAHSAIAGSDVPFTAAAFVALVLLARWAERPSPGRWMAVGLGIGLAWAMRHTALLLLPMAGLVHLVVRFRLDRPKGWGERIDWLFGSIWAGAGASLLAFTVLWAGDGFGAVTLAEVAERVMMVRVPRRIGPLDISGLPVPTSLLSILKQIRHQNQGHEAYFLGQTGMQGWALYFPVAFLLKTPLGLLGLMVLAAARVRPRGAWSAIALGFLVVLWVMLVRNKVNIGVRYAMLTYPLAMPFLARLFAPGMLRDRLWGPLTLALAAWLAWASFACEGKALSSFNEIGGGPGRAWVYLADSNVDWGQDFQALREAIARRGITEITYDLSSERRLTLPGVVAVRFPAKAMQVPAVTPPNRRLYDAEGGYLPVYTRYFAVGVSKLMGLYSQNDVSWLRSRRLVERVGDSIFLFDLDQPADRPLIEQD
jgi:4-amino-4-deoxy-L-arabinose transferase-like glycosyltransferase